MIKINNKYIVIAKMGTIEHKEQKNMSVTLCNDAGEKLNELQKWQNHKLHISQHTTIVKKLTSKATSIFILSILDNLLNTLDTL